MADTKPPRLSTDEVGTLTALLAYQRNSLVAKTAGLTDEQAAWSPVPTGTSLLWLIGHMTEAEGSWVVRRFAGRAWEPDAAPENLADAVAGYRAMWTVVDAVVAGAGGPDAPCAGDDVQPPVNLRWVLAHLLEETARHAGHADIIRELLDGGTGR